MSVDLTTFDASDNPSQDLFLKDMFERVIPLAHTRKQIVVLSGAMGSGKTCAIHFLLDLIMQDNPGYKAAIGRMSVQDATKIFMKEFRDFTPDSLKKNDSAENVEFTNESHIKVVGWGDGNTLKLRSNNLDCFIMEEATEDAGKGGTRNWNYKALKEMFGRVRLNNGPRLIIIITNPDDPETHWLFPNFIKKARYVDGVKQKGKDLKNNINVYYSKSIDNPHNGPDYVEDMKENFSEKQYLRYALGQWVSLESNGIYYEYKEDEHYLRDLEYEIDMRYPVGLTFDFNTAKGKPMSCMMAQYIDNTLYCFDELLEENSSTRQVMETLEEDGFFKLFNNPRYKLIIYGDASGNQKAPTDKTTPYKIIKQFLDNLPYKVYYEIDVAAFNPGLKDRHDNVNKYLKTASGRIRIYLYKKCEGLNKGLKSTQLKKSSKYQEEETYYQHITTALGYMLCQVTESDIAEIEDLTEYFDDY